MALDEFRQTYVRLCRDNHVEVQDVIMDQIISAQKKHPNKSSGYCLNLSANSLTIKTCAVLAKVLAVDRAFSEIKLNDCMLTEEGVKAIAHGLASNNTCRKLDLKGNNIRGTAVEGLGRMLKQNTRLLSLCLEWNAVGMLDTSFSVFCEGLGGNCTLQVLDLRNNQITHDGTTELAAALKRNGTLRALDLRWNQVGLIGGRALLTSLDLNRSLVKLELAGNNTPNDIVQSIESAVSHNADRASLTQEYTTRTDMMNKEMQHLQHSKVAEMSGVLDKLDRQERALRHSNKSSQDRIAQLQQALDERKIQFNNLNSKMSLAESELALSESKVNELSALLQQAKEEQKSSGKAHQRDLKHEREDKAVIEARLSKELIEVNEKNMELENKVDELQRKVKTQHENMYEVKEQLAHTQAEHKIKAAQFDEKIQMEKQKTKDAYQEMELLKHKEVERVRKDADDTEQSLKDRLQRLELQRLELEEEVSRLKGALASERLHAEEHLMLTKQRMKQEEEQHCRQLEDKIRMLQTSKEELHSHSMQQAGNVSELQARNSNMTLENETLRRKIDDLNQEIGGKNNEMMAEVGKAKLELTQRIQRLEGERQTQSELYDKITRLERELAEAAAKQKSSTESSEREIAELKEKVHQRDNDLKRMQDDDAQRVSILQNAIQNYASRKPYQPS